MIRPAIHVMGLAALLAASSAPAQPDWSEILDAQRGATPPPRPAVVWMEDFTEARRVAVRENRPLFVTMRCIPCKQCSAFDKEVLEGGTLLDPLLSQFVTVRLTDAMNIDFRFFPVEGFQDLDMSWWGWFLSPQGHVYGVYGGRDEVSDATRISVESLAATLRRVLEHHYAPDRASWDIDGPEAQRAGQPRTARDLPGWNSWVRKTPEPPDNCLHCHQIVEVLRQPEIDAGTFERTDLDVWPLPENVGLTVERDDGLLVIGVEEDTPAAAAGLRPGDRLAAAGDRRLFGQADLRAALHRAGDGSDRIPVVWWRGDRVMEGDLETAGRWKETVLDWRMSVSQGNIGPNPGFWPLGTSSGERRRVGMGDDGMAIKPFFGRNRIGPAFDAGLRPGHIITAVNGNSTDISGRPFLVWFRLNHSVGDRVKLTVVGGPGGPRVISYVLR